MFQNLQDSVMVEMEGVSNKDKGLFFSTSSTPFPTWTVSLFMHFKDFIRWKYPRIKFESFELDISNSLNELKRKVYSIISYYFQQLNLINIPVLLM